MKRAKPSNMLLEPACWCALPVCVCVASQVRLDEAGGNFNPSDGPQWIGGPLWILVPSCMSRASFARKMPKTFLFWRGHQNLEPAVSSSVSGCGPVCCAVDLPVLAQDRIRIVTGIAAVESELAVLHAEDRSGEPHRNTCRGMHARERRSARGWRRHDCMGAAEDCVAHSLVHFRVELVGRCTLACLWSPWPWWAANPMCLQTATRSYDTVEEVIDRFAGRLSMARCA